MLDTVESFPGGVPHPSHPPTTLAFRRPACENRLDTACPAAEPSAHVAPTDTPQPTPMPSTRTMTTIRVYDCDDDDDGDAAATATAATTIAATTATMIPL